LSAGDAAWIRDDRSLTKRVIAACDGRFAVRVLRQQRARPLPSERRLLGLAGAGRALVREVELLCDGVPWVFARTLIPFSSLRGRARRLAHLGDRPLGAVLFADPTTERRCVEVARLGMRHSLFASAVRNLDHRPGTLWGRRTLFVYADSPLLVNEIFLPAIPPVESK